MPAGERSRLWKRQQSSEGTSCGEGGVLLKFFFFALAPKKGNQSTIGRKRSSRGIRKECSFCRVVRLRKTIFHFGEPPQGETSSSSEKKEGSSFTHGWIGRRAYKKRKGGPQSSFQEKGAPNPGGRKFGKRGTGFLSERGREGKKKKGLYQPLWKGKGETTCY